MTDLESILCRAREERLASVGASDFRCPPVRHLTDAERAECRALRARGLTQGAIAEELRVNQTTVSRALRGGR